MLAIFRLLCAAQEIVSVRARRRTLSLLSQAMRVRCKAFFEGLGLFDAASTLHSRCSRYRREHTELSVTGRCQQPVGDGLIMDRLMKALSLLFADIVGYPAHEDNL